MQEEKEEPLKEQESPPKEEQVSSQEQEIATLKQELQEAKDKYLRVLADAENTRKRMQKERQEFLKFAVEGALVEFLAPLDSFENALKFAKGMSEEVRNWAIGFEMILSQFKGVLASHGFEPFDSIGKTFDPRDHEAVEMVETQDAPAGVVIAEFSKGYKAGDKTVRPARVKVAKAPLAQANEGEQTDIKENV